MRRSRCVRGLFVEAQARQPDVAPGGTVNVTATVLNRSPATVGMEGARIEGIWNRSRLQVKAGSPGIQPERRCRVQPGGAGEPAIYAAVLAGEAALGRRLPGGRPDADRPARYAARGPGAVRLTVDGAPIELVRPVHHRYADRAQGERVRPFVVVPMVAVNLPEPVAVFPRVDGAQSAGCRCRPMWPTRRATCGWTCPRVGRPSRIADFPDRRRR